MYVAVYVAKEFCRLMYFFFVIVTYGYPWWGVAHISHYELEKQIYDLETPSNQPTYQHNQPLLYISV